MKQITHLAAAAFLLSVLGRAAFGQSLTYTPYAFTEFAGSVGQKGSTNGTGTAALLNQPVAIAVDNGGNLYITDQGNSAIRKITPAGVVTTFAGNTPFPLGIAVDASGDVFVSDGQDNVIRKFTAAGVVSTLAGTSGVTGSADGTGAAAQFNTPGGLAVDANDNVYVADIENDTIRKITSAGVVTTIAGAAGVAGSLDGTGSAATFKTPYGVALDGAGNLFVTDSGNATIRKVTPGGTVSTFAGSAGAFGAVDGTGSGARFGGLVEGIAVDASGNLFVVDSDSDLIRRITPAAVVTTIAGIYLSSGEGDGTGSGAAFKEPTYVTVDSNGNVYVVDGGANTIRKGVSAIPPSLPTVAISGSLPSAPITNGSAPFTLTATTTGEPTSYQWYLNGVAITGATNAVEVVNATAADQGDYSVTVSNAAGSASAAAGSLAVTTDAWLVNLSARAYAQTGANELIAGFVTKGVANKAILVRGDGPSLAGFNVTGFLTDPTLTLVAASNSATLATANSWSTSLDATFAAVGAYALTPGSHDDAVLESLAPGSYTAQVASQTTNNGVALAEVYDADLTAPANRLINLSARVSVGTGANILIGGFVIDGKTPQTIVVRGIGPGLTPFNVPSVLSSTTLTLSNSAGDPIAMNIGWSNGPTAGSGAKGGIVVQPLTAALSAKVGAFSLAPGSSDSGIVATLPPGAYTAQVSGAGNSTGVALVEIYELR